MSEPFKALHKEFIWEPYKDVRFEGFRRSDGMGYVLKEDEHWWATWAHDMLCGKPGWHHHAFGSYASAMAAAMAFDTVYDLERITGNKDRCPNDYIPLNE